LPVLAVLPLAKAGTVATVFAVALIWTATSLVVALAIGYLLVPLPSPKLELSDFLGSDVIVVVTAKDKSLTAISVVEHKVSGHLVVLGFV
jgi:hypothetical protein